MKTTPWLAFSLALACFTPAFADAPARDPNDFKLKKAALEGFWNHLDPRLILAQEPPPEQTLIRLAFEVPNFAKEGEAVWEFRFYANDKHGKLLRGIIWVHPDTYAVKRVIGGWKE